jgi:hypothetical protein
MTERSWRMNDRATEKQLDYYKYLCEQACIEPDEDADTWSTREMSQAIKELKEIIGDG